MAKHKPHHRIQEIFVPGKYKQFKKGDMYRDPRIQQQGGQKDFLIISNKQDDFDMLRRYLGNEMTPRYPSEEYNMFTTGTDANGTPMVGLYWMDEHMEQTKKAIILCQQGSEEDVLEIVDEFCLEQGEKRVIDKLNEQSAPTTSMKTELVKAAVSQFQHPNLSKYQTVK